VHFNSGISQELGSYSEIHLLFLVTWTSLSPTSKTHSSRVHFSAMNLINSSLLWPLGRNWFHCLMGLLATIFLNNSYFEDLLSLSAFLIECSSYLSNTISILLEDLPIDITVFNNCFANAPNVNLKLWIGEQLPCHQLCMYF
jgi:hypothetical protein